MVGVVGVVNILTLTPIAAGAGFFLTAISGLSCALAAGVVELWSAY